MGGPKGKKSSKGGVKSSDTAKGEVKKPIKKAQKLEISHILVRFVPGINQTLY